MAGDLTRLSRDELASLGREYLLAGHLIDRAGMPLVLGEHGLAAMREVAIEEWMVASPLYTRRMQRLLGIEGTDVATIFKGMQLDIGAPPEFMDFRYRVQDETHGEFWLASCGALMDVEPMGDELVETMCHHIEDPTFDATAQATNPGARIRPVHRPPRRPADRHPHCHWTVEISDSEPATSAPGSGTLDDSEAARLPVVPPGPATTGDDGLTGYADAFDPELRLEVFSQAALLAIADEVCLQGHLLSLAFAQAVTARFGLDAAASLSLRQFTGIAGLAARRLAKDSFLPQQTPRPGGASHVMVRLARVLELHPAFRPRRYVDLTVGTPETTEEGVGELLVTLGPCPALGEQAPSWIGLLAAGHTEPLDAIVQAVEPRLRVEVLDSGSSWRVRFDPAELPARAAKEVELAAFSTGAEFAFVDEPRRRQPEGAPT